MMNDETTSTEERRFDIGGVTASARLLRASDKALVVLLHGAVNRKKRQIPFFQPFLRGLPDISQLAVADPAMEHFSAVPACWYLGWKGHRLWETLGEAIQSQAQQLGAARTFYLGGSTGGFAALLLSHQHKDSIAVLRNPQVSLRNHVYGRAAQMYLRRAWDDEPEFHNVPVDLSDLYAENMTNRVIYLQSPGDYLHLHVHAAHFLSRLPRDHFNRIVFDAHYRGIQGHGGSVPDKVAVQWIQAALTVNLDVDEWHLQMLDAYHSLASQKAAANPASIVGRLFPRADRGLETGIPSDEDTMKDVRRYFSPEDIDLAAKLSAYQEGQT